MRHIPYALTERPCRGRSRTRGQRFALAVPFWRVTLATVGSRKSGEAGISAKKLLSAACGCFSPELHLSERRDAELLDILSRREMYTFLYPLDACHPDPPAILPGNVYPKKVNT
jgi:hypothetical protein